MENNSFDWDIFWKFPVVGIMRGFETELALEIAEQSFAAGLTSLEVTLNTPNAFNQIRRIRNAAPEGVHVGAGTVISLDGLHRAIDAGAQFIVCPTVNVEIIQSCVKQNIPVFPGALTPTEVVTAFDAGASVIKLFPVGIGGPKYLKSVRGPLDHIPLLAVDGVNLDNLQSYIDAGAAGIGLGGQFYQLERMLARDWDWLKHQISSFQAFWDT